MFKKYTIILALILLIPILSGCNIIKKINNQNANNSAIQEVETKGDDSQEIEVISEPKVIDPIIEQIGKMTIDEKIGQMLIVGIEGYDLDGNSKSLIVKSKVGGVILFSNNVQGTSQLLNLLNSLKSENQHNKIPLFLSVDEEGGRVTRMPVEFKKIPTNKAIGKINNEALSNKIGATIAYEIGAFGFNMDFSPVLDINSNPNNPVIGDRSFGRDVNIVSRLGIQTMKGIQSANIIPVVKHFPGHGDTAVDSHLGLPSVNNDLERLESFELIPFEEAIKNNADAVMIAHILLPKIDSENPSSLSKIIITDILRNNLNFNGVIITDDMTMGAIVKNYNISEAAVKSVKAGTDIVLVCHGYDNEISVINALKNAVSEGEIVEQRIDESVYRILMLKKKYKLKDEIIDAVDVEFINNKIYKLLKDKF